MRVAMAGGKQIPPLRCGMTNKKAGNGKGEDKSNRNDKGNRRSFDCAVRKMREQLRSG
jgi:hypothetical protein